MRQPTLLLYVNVFFVLFVYVYVESTLDAKKNQCAGKRQSCLNQCVRTSRNQRNLCRKESLRTRTKCIRVAHHSGKQCVKNQTCPEAKECYQRCNQTASPIKCFSKQGCAKKRSSCYAACQSPIGKTLQQCLDGTSSAIENCKTSAANSEQSCQKNCPSCP